MAYLSIDEELVLNRWVQGNEDDSAVLRVFSEWSKRGDDILLSVSQLCKQASPRNEHIEVVLRNVPFNPERSACVLLSKGISSEIFFRLRSLKGRDAEDAFWVFLHLLKVADQDRKRNKCKGECSHWWHRDLSDPVVLLEIKREYEAGRL
jgi:hypothetical protein